jgi:hypothetical protein
LLALSLTAPLMAQRTWIVDFHGGAGVDFADIPSAITAAAAGDRIEVYGSTLVGPTYAPFVVDKTLDVEAMQGARVAFFHVENIATGSSVRVAGFRCEPAPTYFTQDDCVLVRNCTGSVLLSALEVIARPADTFDGCIVRDAAAVAIQDCTARGRSAGLYSGGAGLVLERSGVSIVRTTVTGGNGGSSASNAAGYEGGPGLVVRGSSVICAMSTLAGGHPGYGWAFQGNGGDAVRTELAATLLLAACTITAGAAIPGVSLDGDAIDGVADATADCVITGAMTNGASLVPTETMLAADANTALGGTLGLAITGTAGTQVLLALDVNHEHRALPGFSAPFLLTPNFVVLAAGTLPVASVTLGFAIPVLPILHERDVYFQALAVEATGTSTLTPLAVTRLR